MYISNDSATEMPVRPCVCGVSMWRRCRESIWLSTEAIGGRCGGVEVWKLECMAVYCTPNGCSQSCSGFIDWQLVASETS